MSYQRMAHLYDRLMEDAPYDHWLSFTKEIFRKKNSNIKTIADLGCGTGQLTTRLASEGYKLIGVDFSSDMLSLAEQRASAENLSIQWVHQDLKMLEGLGQLDAAVSYCDVINYITEEDALKTVFQRVAESLKPGGLFIFDIHALKHVENNYVNQTFAEDAEDVSYIWFCSAGDEPGEMHHDLTFFVSLEDGTYTRFDEYHHQRTYPVHFYKKILHETGFENCNLYADFSLENEFSSDHAERIFIVAEKRPEK